MIFNKPKTDHYLAISKILSQLVMVGSLLGANPGFNVLNAPLIAGKKSPIMLIADIR